MSLPIKHFSCSSKFRTASCSQIFYCYCWIQIQIFELFCLTMVIKLEIYLFIYFTGAVSLLNIKLERNLHESFLLKPETFPDVCLTAVSSVSQMSSIWKKDVYFLENMSLTIFTVITSTSVGTFIQCLCGWKSLGLEFRLTSFATEMKIHVVHVQADTSFLSAHTILTSNVCDFYVTLWGAVYLVVEVLQLLH